MQARHYLKATDSLRGNDFPAIVDFEAQSLNGKKTSLQVLKDLHLFLDMVEHVTGRVPVIYTGNDVASVYFAGHQLWTLSFVDCLLSSGSCFSGNAACMGW